MTRKSRPVRLPASSKKKPGKPVKTGKTLKAVRTGTVASKRPVRRGSSKTAENKKVQVFIGWSGGDKAVCGRIADALYDFLDTMCQPCCIWISRKKLPSGGDWHAQIAEATVDAQYGIFCLTPEPHNLRWIHFEAGMLYQAQRLKNHEMVLLKGKLIQDKPLERIVPLFVIPRYPYDLEGGPLAQFHSVKLFSDTRKAELSQRFQVLVHAICQDAAGEAFDYNDFLTRWETQKRLLIRKITRLGKAIIMENRRSHGRRTDKVAERQEHEENAMQRLDQIQKANQKITEMDVRELTEKLQSLEKPQRRT